MLKDLYQEMEKIKQGSLLSSISITIPDIIIGFHKLQLTSILSDVKAVREKNGVYIPNERFVLEEAEKKVYSVS